jgi:hypothetical protein
MRAHDHNRALPTALPALRRQGRGNRRTKGAMMTKRDLERNGVYRAKNPIRTDDGFDDRIITAVGKKRVYYLTEPMLRYGRKPGRTQIGKFLAWAGERLDTSDGEVAQP